MHRRPLLGVVALVTARCIAQTPVDLPDTTGAHTMIILATSGDARAATVVAVDGASRVPVALDGAAELFVLLYAATPEALRLVPGAIVLAAPDACGRTLPPPTRAFRADAGGRTLAWRDVRDAGLDVPELRVRPTPGVCPTLDVAALAIDCAFAACRPRFEQQGCAISIDTADCGLGVLTGELGAKGELCFEPSARLGRCDEAAPAPDALRSLDCDGGARAERCAVDLHAPAEARRFEIARAALLDAEPLDPPGFERPPRGYLADLAVLDGALAVVGSAHDESWMCVENRPGRLWLVDPDTLAVTATAALPPCLTQLAPDPRGDGFVAAFGGQAAELGRFDRAGHLVARLAWSGAPDNVGHRASSLVVHDGAPPIAAMTMTNTARTDDELPSALFLVDLERFVELAPRRSTGDQLRELARYDGAELLATDDSYAGVSFVTPATAETRPGPSLLGTAVRSILDPGVPLWHAPTRQLLLSTTGIGGGVFVFASNDELVGRARPFERPGDVWALTPWPADPRLVLVAMTDREAPRRASLALVDPAAPRFLPGTEPLGDGAVGRFRTDRRGIVYAVLPWTAEVVRISALQAPR